MSENNKPIRQFRIGLIVAGVFANEHEEKTFYNVSITRLYKADADDPDWKRTHSFGRDDLPKVQEVANQAWRFIHERQQAS